MNTKEKVRQGLCMLAMKATGADKYGNNAYVIINGKKFFVGRMSYNEYYIEPYSKGRTERNKFKRGTLWEKSDTAEIIDILIAEGLF